MPSGSANYSRTNGERKYVDSPTTFIIGNGSNLKVGKVENTAGAIGTSGSGKLSIDEYVGHNLENVDKLKTVGASVGVSASGVNNMGVNYYDKKQEGITKNTVIGNVEIGKSSESLYKTDPNWSWEKIVQKQVDKGLSGDDIYKEIIASSQRSRDVVNKSLGVK